MNEQTSAAPSLAMQTILGRMEQLRLCIAGPALAPVRDAAIVALADAAAAIREAEASARSVSLDLDAQVKQNAAQRAQRDKLAAALQALLSAIADPERPDELDCAMDAAYALLKTRSPA